MSRPALRVSSASPLPRAPVLDWNNFLGGPPQPLPTSVQHLPDIRYTTSGRAAIFQALGQVGPPAGSAVLVPTYHCPTMVAPVVLRGLRPVYFGLQGDGLPDLAELDRRDPVALIGARAMIVAHYFGLPRSLAPVRAWCDARGIALIEDCAHCFFGDAGERPVGAWGDYATASLSKFFPVPEAGLLGSAQHRLRPIELSAPRLKAELKGCVDVLEFAVRHRRLRGLRAVLGTVFALKNRRFGRQAVVDASEAPADEAATLACCDMDRVSERPLRASMALNARLRRERIVARRQANYVRYGAAFADVAAARPLFPAAPPHTAPYVFPLWVDNADPVYHGMRALGLPVFRWDRAWPGTPVLSGDVGAAWSRHVLQLLCHQDLGPDDIEHVIATTLRVLSRAAAAPNGRVGALAGGLMAETQP